MIKTSYIVLSLLTLLSFPRNCVAEDAETVHRALVALYKSTQGDLWKNNDGWDVNTVPLSIEDFQQWYGIRVVEGKVVEIRLPRNLLYGSIPPEIGYLTDLEVLDLSEHGKLLSGQIPSELGNMTNLRELNLLENWRITGPIPPELGNLSKLEKLLLNPCIRRRGRDVDSYRFTLTGSIPPELGNLTNLVELDLACNNLEGPPPRELGNLVNLEKLYLSGNKLTGAIPRSFLHLKKLAYFTYRQQDGPWQLENIRLCLPKDDFFVAWYSFIVNADRHVIALGGDCDPLIFLSVKQESIAPTEFTIQANYPNPFRYSTRIRFDLPQPSRVGIEVLDVTGRRVFSQSPIDFSAGWDQELFFSEPGMSPGFYLYRLTANTSENTAVHTGRFVKLR